MFEKRNIREAVFWTILFYMGWTGVGIVSQLVPLDPRIIRLSRNMDSASQRLTFTLLTAGNVLLGAILVRARKLRWGDLGYIFLVGSLVEFCLEFSLAVSGIRLEQGAWSPALMAINTAIEFNMGIVVMYIIWAGFKRIRDGAITPPITWADRRGVATDFNIISLLAKEPDSAKQSRYFRRLAQYSKDAVAKDIDLFWTAHPDRFHPEISPEWVKERI